jgi:hypothetical protein
LADGDELPVIAQLHLPHGTFAEQPGELVIVARRSHREGARLLMSVEAANGVAIERAPGEALGQLPLDMLPLDAVRAFGPLDALTLNTLGVMEALLFNALRPLGALDALPFEALGTLGPLQ